MTRTSRTPQPSLAELAATAAYARDRVTLHRRRVLLGRGDQRRLDELQRVADGADDRLREARAKAVGDA